MLSNVLPLSRDPTMMDPLETKSNSQSMDMQKMVRVQCMVRGFIHRLRMKKEYCAIMLQSLYRGYRERCKFDAMLSG